jgi:hypothetical protein
VENPKGSPRISYFPHFPPLYDPPLQPSTVCVPLPKNPPIRRKTPFPFRNRSLTRNVKVLFKETVAKKPRFPFFYGFSSQTMIFRGSQGNADGRSFRFSAPKTAQTAMKNDKIRTNATQMPVAMVSSLTNPPCVPARTDERSIGKTTKGPTTTFPRFEP